MQAKTFLFTNVGELLTQQNDLLGFKPSFVIAFASPEYFAEPQFLNALNELCANSIGCSTAGEIADKQVYEHSITLLLVRFESDAYVRLYEETLPNMQCSFAAGQTLSKQIEVEKLRGIYVLAPGIDINGSALINGLLENLPKEVGISGGLAGDNGAFEQTHVLSPTGVSSQKVVAIGFYGDKLHFGYGAHGGWRSFGPTRSVTKATENQLFELDDMPALDIYKRYLGEYAKDLPSSGLLFPFEVLDDDGEPTGLIRTILGVDEQTKSLVLAGEIKETQYLRLMHASTDDLIDGAAKAISLANSQPPAASTCLAIVTSCVGRKLVMGDRIEEEIEEVSSQLQANTTISGFYSYGEISPFHDTTHCKLHNQTLTMMLLRELL